MSENDLIDHNEADQLKNSLRQQLAALLNEASDIQQKIDTAKTTYKKQFYTKKIKPISKSVQQLLFLLKRIEERTATAEQTDSL